MTYATATANPCIAACNLSTANNHYETCNNLCSTITSSLEAVADLSAGYDLQRQKGACGTSNDLSSTTRHPF